MTELQARIPFRSWVALRHGYVRLQMVGDFESVAASLRAWRELADACHARELKRAMVVRYSGAQGTPQDLEQVARGLPALGLSGFRVALVYPFEPDLARFAPLVAMSAKLDLEAGFFATEAEGEAFLRAPA